MSHDPRTNEELQKELDKLYDLLKKETTEKGRGIVKEIVDTEIELESRCNI